MERVQMDSLSNAHTASESRRWPQKKIRILVAEDQLAIGGWIGEVLNSQEMFQVVATVLTTSHILEIVKTFEPDMLVLDLTMPGDFTASEILKRASEEFPTMMIVGFTTDDNLGAMRTELKIGAHEYCSTFENFGTFDHSHSQVAPAVFWSGQAMSEPRTTSSEDNISPLTRRELDVLRGLARAMSNKQIAEELSIAESTVDRHVVNMLEKTGYKNRTALALSTLKIGIISRGAAESPNQHS